MILILSRGSFCPKDHKQHLELAANYPKINVAYTQIVTISTDNILETNGGRPGTPETTPCTTRYQPTDHVTITLRSVRNN
jgi:hypothetical protein